MNYKPRVSRITEEIFNEVHQLKKDLPNATNQQIGKLVKCRGGLSETSVAIISRCKEYQEYRDYNKRKFSKAEPEKEGPETKVYEENVLSTIGRTVQDRKNDRIADLLMQIVEILKE